MNVLEYILEEIEEKIKLAGRMMVEKPCDKLDEIANDTAEAFIGAYEECSEIIRSHMDEVTNMSGKRLIDANALDDEVMNFFLAITGNPKQTTVVRECKESFRRMIDEQPTIYANDGWIPVSKRLPEVPEGTEDFYCPEFNVTIKDASKATTLKYAPDETWFDDSGEVYNVMAWQPLPEPYKPEEDKP